LLFLAVPALVAGAAGGGGIAAITQPSADITLAFLQPGRIDGIPVKEGDMVSERAVVAQMYDAAETAYLAQKEVDLKRLEEAAKRNAATDLEVEHARLEVKIARIRVDNMKLRSPIKGFVEKIDVEVGESVQALKEVIRIVRTDPLWIDVHVPQAAACAVKVGEKASVRFPGPNSESAGGEIVFVAQAADAASDTRRVKIEIANKAGRPSGEHVLVSFNEGGKTNETD